MKKILSFLSVVAMALMLLPMVTWAATIYTTQAGYNSAVSGMTLSWSEDFEGFSQGAVAVPTIIGSGAAEISKTGTAQIIQNYGILDPSGLNEWLGLEAGFGETIQGVGGLSLEVSAISFEYFSQLPGNYVFHHTGGVDNGSLGADLTPLFIGWVGDPGEVLNFIDYLPTTSAHILDNFVAYTASPIPEPATMILFGFGLLGLAGVSRRKK